jgi:hypothetical protein
MFQPHTVAVSMENDTGVEILLLLQTPPDKIFKSGDVMGNGTCGVEVESNNNKKRMMMKNNNNKIMCAKKK